MISIPRTSGIYKITCATTGKLYIGSAVNLYYRWQDHRKELRRNGHGNSKLQNAWNKYGEQSFTFEVLELVLPISLTAREQYWFEKLKPFGNKGFNIARVAGSSLGCEVSPETREKLRQFNLGKPAHNRGKPCPPEQRERLRQVNLGKKASPEARENMRLAKARYPHPMLGKHHTPESIARMSASKRGKPNPNRGKPGKPHTPEARAKISQMRMGHQVSPETRAKLSKSSAGNQNSLGREHSAEERIKTARTRRGNKDVIATSPDGTEYTIQNVQEFCREHNLDASSLIKVAKGKYKHHRDWKARYTNSLWPS